MDGGEEGEERESEDFTNGDVLDLAALLVPLLLHAGAPALGALPCSSPELEKLLVMLGRVSAGSF